MYELDLNTLVTDAEGDDLTFTLVGTCAGFTVSGDNLVGSDTGGVVPMATTAGNKACSVTASDGTSMPTIAFTVPVTDIPPVLTAVNDTESGTEDEAMITGNVIDGSSGGRDTSPTATPTVVRYAAGSSLVGAVNAPASAPGTHGRLTIATTGALTYTVAASNNALTTGASNTDTFTYEITDGTASRETATLTITVTGVNDAPVQVSPLPPIRTALVGTMYELDLNTLVTDAEGDDLTFTLVGTCAGFTVSGDNLVGSDTGGVVPMATTAGNKACSVTASDGTSMPTIAFTVPVTDIPPVLTAMNDTASGTEDGATITGNVIDGNSGGRDTAPSGTPTVTRYAAGSSLAGAVNAPASAAGTYGRLTIATTGAFTYTVAASNNALAPGRSNTDTFTYEIMDGTASRETATLTITVTGVNDMPTADLQQVVGGTVGQLYELDLDTVFSDPDGMTLNYSTPSGGCDAIFTLATRAGSSGNRVLVGSGTGRIIPEGTEEGAKACTITASDGTLSTMQTLRIDVQEEAVREHVRNALGGIARTLGWDAVDAVRSRMGADGAGGVDLSGLTARLREFAATESGVTGESRFDGMLPVADQWGNAAVGRSGAAYGAAGRRGMDDDFRVWTSATRSDMEFEAGETTYDGDLETVRVGIEGGFGDMQGGVAVSYSTGETEFGTSGGLTDFRQVGVTPYATRSWGNTQAWALAGVGVGTLDYAHGQGAGRREASSSTMSRMLAAGLEHHVPGMAGGMDVTARAEAMVSGLEADGTALYEKVSASTRGGRGEIEVGMPSASGDRFWRPYVTAGVRWDDGEGESDTAFEYGGGIEATTPSLALDASLRSQGGGDFDRMSYALTFSFDVGQDMRGLTASLTREYGLERRDPFARGVRHDGGEMPGGSDAFSLRVGYGASAWQGLLVPYLETNLDEGSFSAAHLGLAYTRGPASVKLEHGFRSDAGQTRDGHELSLLGEIRF